MSNSELSLKEQLAWFTSSCSIQFTKFKNLSKDEIEDMVYRDAIKFMKAIYESDLKYIGSYRLNSKSDICPFYIFKDRYTMSREYVEYCRELSSAFLCALRESGLQVNAIGDGSGVSYYMIEWC